ncbi:uncharacterized protein IL334_007949 [Kwoniella shivajii]|uniref:Uncharacterized protein n=1 Tax=Kwoniella shivajii TaxID=564305 RepID=A0ABZ1DAP2_9TREE|nr:hypothetical protein IL334_007949 [Kwoniella shivajii]
MKFTTTSLFILGLATYVSADSYANFFSVYIPNTGLINDQFCLVSTHDDGSCSCQSQAYDFTATGFCHELDDTVGSYRFIHESCGSDNCP